MKFTCIAYYTHLCQMSASETFLVLFANYSGLQLNCEFGLQ